MNNQAKHLPLVSVIVPIYNRENTLDTCIKSILASEYKKIEVILIDDGSTDRSREVCQRYVDSDSRVTLVSQANEGVSAARNLGISKANGEWISFIDSDDAIQPGFYQKLVDAGLDDVDLAMVGRCMGVQENNRARPVREATDTYTKYIEGNAEVIKFLFGEFNPYKHGFFLCTDKLFRHSILIEKEIRFCEDISLDEDQVFVLNYLQYVNGFYYDSTPYYLSLQWENIEKNNRLGSKLRMPEEYMKTMETNYVAFSELYRNCPDTGLKAYQVNYILDRPFTKILYQYCLLDNIKKYGYRRLRQFTKGQILPLLGKERYNVGMVRNKLVAYFNRALFYQPFLLVYFQLVVTRNIIHYCPYLANYVKRLLAQTGITVSK